MEYKKMKDVIYLRIDQDESVIDTIQEVCRREKVYTGYFWGIGACDLAILSTYLPDRNEFIDHTISGMIEISPLWGIFLLTKITILFFIVTVLFLS